MPQSANGQSSRDMQECIRACGDCHEVCLQTVAHCLQMGGKHAEGSHISLLLSCADICATTANTMLLGSDVHKRICAACAEVCEQCAQDCERVDPNNAQMKACADSCRRCAESCHRMAA